MPYESDRTNEQYLDAYMLWLPRQHLEQAEAQDSLKKILMEFPAIQSLSSNQYICFYFCPVLAEKHSYLWQQIRLMKAWASSTRRSV